ncbi:hypothetical protein [Immundisolibacter cernigliae]|uniref:Uncharacterized protein n=1 Tax=Immundisolibacter cernigliae TaxID=1810504 RepID=A0A1B1YRM5_9GAMM|nr:hypothetical protein [Immundisolibacter cernigliae]ANX03458.1 hypothetical protein PG2T_04140 [Immundisolibacter cernigliae]
MQFSFADRTIGKQYAGETFALSPTAQAVAFPQPWKLPYFGISANVSIFRSSLMMAKYMDRWYPVQTYGIARRCSRAWQPGAKRDDRPAQKGSYKAACMDL